MHLLYLAWGSPEQPSYSIGRIAEFGSMYCGQIVSDTQGWGQALQKDFHLCDGSALSTGWEGLVRVESFNKLSYGIAWLLCVLTLSIALVS